MPWSSPTETVTEINVEPGFDGSQNNQFTAALGSEIRVILESTSGTGASGFDVQISSPSVRFVKMVQVDRQVNGPHRTGTGRVDAILAADSLGTSRITIDRRSSFSGSMDAVQLEIEVIPAPPSE